MFKKNVGTRKLEKFERDKEYSCMEQDVNSEARKAFKEPAYACKASKPKRMTLEEYYEERCKKRGKK